MAFEFQLFSLPEEAVFPEKGMAHFVVALPDSTVNPSILSSGGGKPSSQGQWYTVGSLRAVPEYNRVEPGSSDMMVPVLQLSLHSDWLRRTAAMYQMTIDMMRRLPEGRRIEELEKFWLWLYRDRDPQVPPHIAIAMRFNRP